MQWVGNVPRSGEVLTHYRQQSDVLRNVHDMWTDQDGYGGVIWLFNSFFTQKRPDFLLKKKPDIMSNLQIAVCCSVLQCVAVCCSVLECVAVCYSVLQCVAVCCNVLQCVAVCCP